MPYDPDSAERVAYKRERTIDQYKSGLISERVFRLIMKFYGASTEAEQIVREKETGHEGRKAL